MNPLVRRYLKSAIIFLAIGLMLGFWMILSREFGTWQPPRLRSAHTHAILVGFIMMMIAGVALWMFPRPRADDRRFKPVLAEISWWMITLGTAGRILLELTLGAGASPFLRGTLVAAGAMQIVGLLLLFWTMWSRIRSSGAKSDRR